MVVIVIFMFVGEILFFNVKFFLNFGVMLVYNVWLNDGVLILI